MAIDEQARMLAAKAYKTANKNTGLQNNLTATRMPSTSDDKDAGYDVGSVWKYNGDTYNCVDSTVGKAIWQNSSDITTFNTWAEVVSALSITSPSYIGQYIMVANANNAPSSGITYVAPNVLTDYIVDGNSCMLKVLAQGINYSTYTCPRTIINPIITSVMLTPSAKFTNRGYYIYCCTPTNGLPTGINLNDICYLNASGQWELYQSYSQANTVLVANNASGITQVTWRKFAGSWMSTADEYVPDGKEYQTGKLWNGKPVYRMCTSGTIQTTAGIVSANITIPSTASVLIVQAVAKRSDNCWFTISLNSTEVNFWVNSTGILRIGLTNATNAPDFAGAPYTAWVEYTKS